mmetsp:Transcript_263/g.786  ORF Transcript_263/g.786 Transcript_263/m.786 type:complete len:235 (-) Transcript_263:168-872(-)
MRRCATSASCSEMRPPCSDARRSVSCLCSGPPPCRSLARAGARWRWKAACACQKPATSSRSSAACRSAGDRLSRPASGRLLSPPAASGPPASCSRCPSRPRAWRMLSCRCSAIRTSVVSARMDALSCGSPKFRAIFPMVFCSLTLNSSSEELRPSISWRASRESRTSSRKCVHSSISTCASLAAAACSSLRSLRWKLLRSRRTSNCDQATRHASSAAARPTATSSLDRGRPSIS